MRRFQGDDRLKRIAALLVSSLMLAASCSSDPVESTADGGGGTGGAGGTAGGGGDSSEMFSCQARSKCPADPPRNVAQCEQMLAHPTCSAVFLKFMKCIGDHQVCKADGTTDIPAWMDPCATEQAENAQCFGMPDAGR